MRFALVVLSVCVAEGLVLALRAFLLPYFSLRHRVELTDKCLSILHDYALVMSQQHVSAAMTKLPWRLRLRMLYPGMTSTVFFVTALLITDLDESGHVIPPDSAKFAWVREQWQAFLADDARKN